jgi:serine protease Do
MGDAVEQLRRTTVQVLSGRGGSGSGVIVSAGGQLVTNAHVVSGATRVRVQIWDGRAFDATVTDRHPSRDLALIQVSNVRDLPAARFASSSALRPGAFVMAIGNPLGFVGALSTGVVHSSGEWIAASVRLAPGNSGGPLADAEGRVVGINSMVARNGLGFAIPSDAVQAFILRPKAPKLGISVHPAQEGLVVLSVEAGSAADRASLRIGDVLINFRSPEDLRNRIERSDGSLLVEFHRGGKNNLRTVMVQLPIATGNKAAAAA